MHRWSSPLSQQHRRLTSPLLLLVEPSTLMPSPVPCLSHSLSLSLSLSCSPSLLLSVSSRSINTCRYVGASEAAWRTFGFKLHGEGAAVERLPVHLPDEQTVVFARDADLTDVVEEGPGITKLQAWFALNERDPAARGLLYMDIPSEYTWQTESSRRVPGPHWKRRVKLLTYPTIGRIYNVGRAQVRSHLRRGLWEVWKLS